MIDIYKYTDYRKYLKDYYEAKRTLQREYTHRYISAVMGFKSTGTFTQILQGKTNIAPETVKQFIHTLELKNSEGEYFELLVHFSQAKSHIEKQNHFKKILVFPKSKIKQIDADQYVYYEKWYYSVVREILAFYKFKDDFRALARMLEPPISTVEAKKSIKLLEKIHLIRKNAEGYYEKSDPVITSGNDTRSLAVNQFIRETLDLAKEALDHLPKEARSLSALTLSLSEAGYAQIEEKIKNLRRELLDMAMQCQEPKRVIQVNFQVFPVTRVLEEGANEKD